MMKKLIALLLALLMVFSMVACTSKQEASQPETDAPAADNADNAENTNNANEEATQTPAEEVTVTWGIYETDNLTAELWDYVIEEFEAANPGIKIEKIVATGDDRASFWKTLSASGNFPDVVLEAEKLAKIDGLFAEVPEDIQALFDTATICTWNGKVTTVPYMKQLRMQCYYNISMFDELGLTEPETWDEFLNICETLAAAGKTPLICGGTGDVWATGQPWWISETNAAMISAYPDFNEKLTNGEIRWDDECIIENLEVWQDLINAGYYHPGCMSYSYSQASAEFQNGAAAMMIDGSWAAAGFDADGNTDFGVFLMPLISGEKTYCTDTSTWGVAESCENKEAAWQFIQWFFTTPEVYAKVLEADGLSCTTLEPVTYEQGALMTKFVQNYDGWTLVPEVIKVQGDYAVAAAMEGELNKSLQNIFVGKDAAEEMADFQNVYDMLE